MPQKKPMLVGDFCRLQNFNAANVWENFGTVQEKFLEFFERGGN
jgi:hypothetical protein